MTDQWYAQLAAVKEYLISRDPKLSEVSVDASGFQLHTVVKDPYVALVGAIIGQKISYTTARALRQQLYTRNPIIIPITMRNADLTFLGAAPALIIKRVTQYILDNNIDLSTEQGIRSLIEVSGIGSWTIETTLLVCLKDWNLFPKGDKFLNKRLERLYGSHYDIGIISANWMPYQSVVTWYLWRWF